jgi:hypothetical protein
MLEVSISFAREFQLANSKWPIEGSCGYSKKMGWQWPPFWEKN